MKIDLTEEIAAPRDVVFRHATDFDALAARFESPNLAIDRQDAQAPTSVGSEWRVRATFSGATWTGVARLNAITIPESFAIAGAAGSLKVSVDGRVTKAGNGVSTLHVAVTVSPASLKGRALMPAIHAAQGRLKAALAARVKAVARDIEAAAA